jgi:hypothetical protein
MPDPLVILESSAAAALMAGCVLLLSKLAWYRRPPAALSIGGTLGVGAGLLVGAWLLGLAPHFPPQEDKDRWLLVLLPATIGVELAAVCLPRLPWLGWGLRLGVAAGAAPVLLYHSVYLSDVAGPGSRAWSSGQAALILGVLATALAASWSVLDRSATRGAGQPVLLALAVTAAGAGITVMLSGYASGGQLGLPLAAGLVGLALASLAFPGTAGTSGAVGVGAVGLFAIVIIGHFFGDLPTGSACLLGVAPLGGAWVEMLPGSRLGPRMRRLALPILAAVPVVLVLTLAVQQFHADATGPTSFPEAKEPSLDDYLNFGR